MDEDLATEIENDPERFLRFPTKYEIHEFVKRNAWREKTMKIKKIVWLLLGLVGLGLGALGAASSAVCAVFDAGAVQLW